MTSGGAAVFSWPVRVYYEDTDCGGVVYHARYLHFFERARTEFLRAAGFSQGRLRQDSGLIFVVRRIEIDYLRPAHYDDELVVLSEVESVGQTSLAFAQSIQRAAAAVGGGASAPDDLCRARVQVVAVDSQILRPRRIPESILREIVR